MKRYTVRMLKEADPEPTTRYQVGDVLAYLSRTDGRYIPGHVLQVEVKRNGEEYVKLQRQTDNKVVTIKPSSKPTKLLRRNGETVKIT